MELIKNKGKWVFSSHWVLLFKRVVYGVEEEWHMRFIHDLQQVNKVTIRNAGIGPTIDVYVEAFAGSWIYLVGDLYPRYDKFQLAVGSKDITTMWTPLGLVQMCTLP